MTAYICVVLTLSINQSIKQTNKQTQLHHFTTSMHELELLSPWCNFTSLYWKGERQSRMLERLQQWYKYGAHWRGTFKTIEQSCSGKQIVRYASETMQCFSVSREQPSNGLLMKCHGSALSVAWSSLYNIDTRLTSSALIDCWLDLVSALCWRRSCLK